MSIIQQKLNYQDDFNNEIFSFDDIDMSLIKIKGKKNKVFIGSNVNLENFIIRIQGNNNVVNIGNNCKLAGKANLRGQFERLDIGEDTTFQSVSLYINEGQSIKIGKDCMFSARIEIRTSDSHSIIDTRTGKRINKPASIVIGNHVWLGKEVIISKGTLLPNNCVVGAKSFVNKKFIDDNVLIAGVPAKQIKDHINWSRELLPLD